MAKTFISPVSFNRNPGELVSKTVFNSLNEGFPLFCKRKENNCLFDIYVKHRVGDHFKLFATTIEIFDSLTVYDCSNHNHKFRFVEFCDKLKFSPKDTWGWFQVINEVSPVVMGVTSIDNKMFKQIFDCEFNCQPKSKPEPSDSTEENALSELVSIISTIDNKVSKMYNIHQFSKMRSQFGSQKKYEKFLSKFDKFVDAEENLLEALEEAECKFNASRK